VISPNADFDFTFELIEAGTLLNIYAGTIAAGGDVTIITAGDMDVGGTG